MSRPRQLALLAAIAATLVVGAVVAPRHSPDSRSPRMLEIELQATAGTVAQLYWSEQQNFSDERSIRLAFRPPTHEVQRFRFPFPSSGVRWLRFDPIDGAGEVTILKAEVLDSSGAVVAALIPDGLRPANQIASSAWERGALRIATTADATDPFLLASLGCLDPPSGWTRLTLFGPAAAALVSLATLGLLLASAIAIGRDAFDRPQAGPATLSRPLLAMWLAALFLVVFSSKLLLMRHTPVTAPFWDQWDGEAAAVFIPASECSLTWRSMLSLHNEHRVFFTRLLALDLLALNRQWDPRLEQVTNAAVHSVTAVLLATILWLAGGRRRLDVLVFVCAAAFALPFAWENILFGFQSAFYFLLLFSVLAIWLTTRYRAWSGPWLLGWACAVCGLFTAASGVVIPLAIAAVALVGLMNDRRGWRDAAANLSVAACVLALGVAASSPPLARHASLRASTGTDFARALAQSLAWPWVDCPELSIVMWLPFSALAGAVLLRRLKTTERERFLVGLAVWAAAHAASVAYARGAGAAPPATRYMDFLNIGFVVNAVALLALGEHLHAGRATKTVSYAVFGGWLLLGTIGAGRLADRALADLGGWRPIFANQAVTVRRFERSGNPADLLDKRPLNDLPYPDPATLVTVLQNPYIRRILPAAVRAPLRVEPRVVTNNAFVEGGAYHIVPRDPLERSWGSFSERGNPSSGRFESAPIEACRAGRLRLQVAGYLGGDKQYLAVKDLRTGRETAVKLRRLPREEWVDTTVRCPEGPFTLVAQDETPDTWFAFREPVEIGWASSLAEWLVARARGLLIASLGLAFLVARWT